MVSLVSARFRASGTGSCDIANHVEMEWYAEGTSAFRPTTEKRLVLVLGMGRSGSSALCRVLALCGGVLHESLLGASDHNERGHWESLEALHLNEAYLEAHGSSWHDVGLGASDHVAAYPPCSDDLIARIRVLLRGRTEGAFLLIKEPRITALADAWLLAARLEGLQVNVVVAVRHPFEVCRSLARRESLPDAASVALWMKYNLLAEAKSRPYPRVFIGYGDLLADWRAQVGRVARSLVLPLAPDAGAIEGFLSSGLRHNRVAGEAWARPNRSDVGTLYAILRAAAGDVPIDPAACDSLLRLYRDGPARRGNEVHCVPKASL